MNEKWTRRVNKNIARIKKLDKPKDDSRKKRTLTNYRKFNKYEMETV